MAQPITISLVLGSGGARGLAHIGVIQWLIENGYVIHSIAGSSMGALVGGIYATGKLEVYAEWVSVLERMDVVRLLDPSFGRAGLFKGERITAFIETLGLARTPDAPSVGFAEIIMASMDTMQDTIARLKLAAYSPDVTVHIPRNACQFHEFWRAEELIALGRERTARAFGNTSQNS